MPCGGEGKCRIYACPFCDAGDFELILECKVGVRR
jgi:hypothetical protein